MRRRKPAGVGGHETAALRRAVAIFQRHGEKVRPAGRGKLVVGDVVPVRVQPDQALVQHRAVSHDLLERAAEPGSRFQDFPRDGVFGGFLRRPDDAPGGEQRIGQALGEARAGQRHPGCGKAADIAFRDRDSVAGEAAGADQPVFQLVVCGHLLDPGFRGLPPRRPPRPSGCGRAPAAEPPAISPPARRSRTGAGCLRGSACRGGYGRRSAGRKTRSRARGSGPRPGSSRSRRGLDTGP